ncbi:MAG: hypothetical protein ACP5M0_15420, partial [Desulfomonilaceae bacterium]
MITSDYQKFVYWLDERTFERFAQTAKDAGMALIETKRAACAPLARRVDLAYVRPSTWSRFQLCKRQLSWYRHSGYSDKILLVSSFDLREHGIQHDGVIRQSSFKPPRLPSDDEKKLLIQRRSYLESSPPEWDNISDSAEQQRWLKVMGLRGIKFKDLFVSHCANHANFIEPIFYINGDNEVIPYSICKTSHVCSACLELYNIIGGAFCKKLVVPCPGAVLFAGLVTNRYYEV